MDREIIFTNARGKSIRLNDNRPFILTKLEGVSAPATSIYSRRAPYQDGRSFSHVTLEPRVIVIEGAFPKDGDRFENRRRLMEVFNPGLKTFGDLQIQMGTLKKKARCIVDSSPVLPETEGPYQRFQVQLFSPDPYLIDVVETLASMTEWEGGVEFPFTWPTVFAVRSSNQTIEIVNGGDVPAPVRIDFYGPATNPKVEKLETGEFIQVNRTLTANEILSIDTSFGNKTVILKNLSTGEEINAFGYLDLSSVFLSLDVGANTLNYTAGETGVETLVEVRYAGRYIGL
jgi:ribosomal protein L25 (general stress protein Ctc)